MTALPVRAGHRTTGPRLVVDLGAIAANTRLFADRVPGELMAVVKADGFGHGAVDVARTSLAHGATRLGVTSIEEALALRAAGIAAPVLSWLNPLDADVAAAVAADVELAVPGRRHLEAVVARAPGARIHLQLDTGMARDGAAPADLGRPVPGRPDGRASRPGPRRRRDGSPRERRHPRRPGQRPRPDPVRLGPGDGPLLRAPAGRPAPGRHLRDAHRPAEPPHDEPRRRRPGRHRPVAHHDPAARPHPDRTPGRRTPRPGRHPGRVRAHLVLPGADHARPGPARVRRRPAPRGLRPRRGAGPRPAPAARRPDLHGHGRGRPGLLPRRRDRRRGHRFGPGDHGEPTVAEWAGWADTIEHEIVTGLGTRLARTTRAHALRSVR